MNPALLELYLNQANANHPSNEMSEFPVGRIGAPKSGWQQLMDEDLLGEEVVPGTGGAVSAPQIPKPQPVYEQLGIVPDPNSNYDTYDTVDYNTAQGMEPGGSRSVEDGVNGVNRPIASPIQYGAQQATDFVRKTRDLDEEEKRRALGVAIMRFAGNMASSDNPSMLGRINESFNPALSSYISERDKYLEAAAKEEKRLADLEIAKIGLDVKQQQRLDKLNKDVQNEKYQNERLNIEHQKLEEQRRHQVAVEQHQKDVLEEKKNKKKEPSAKDVAIVKGNFVKRLQDINEQKRIEYDQKTKGIRGNSPKAEQRRKEIEDQINKRWSKIENIVIKEMKEWGITVDDLIPPGEDNVETGTGLSALEKAKKPDGTYDFSVLSPEELVAAKEELGK